MLLHAAVAISNPQGEIFVVTYYTHENFPRKIFVWYIEVARPQNNLQLRYINISHIVALCYQHQQNWKAIVDCQ